MIQPLLLSATLSAPISSRLVSSRLGSARPFRCAQRSTSSLLPASRCFFFSFCVLAFFFFFSPQLYFPLRASPLARRLKPRLMPPLISSSPVEPSASEVPPHKLLLISARSLVAGWLPDHLSVRPGKVPDYASVPATGASPLATVGELPRPTSRPVPARDNGLDTAASMEPSPRISTTLLPLWYLTPAEAAPWHLGGSRLLTRDILVLG